LSRKNPSARGKAIIRGREEISLEEDGEVEPKGKKVAMKMIQPKTLGVMNPVEVEGIIEGTQIQELEDLGDHQ